MKYAVTEIFVTIVTVTVTMTVPNFFGHETVISKIVQRFDSLIWYL